MPDDQRGLNLGLKLELYSKLELLSLTKPAGLIYKNFICTKTPE